VKEKVLIKTMDEEIGGINTNNILELVDFLEGKNTISFKWIYKTKVNYEVEIEKHKARLVTHGFN